MNSLKPWVRKRRLLLTLALPTFAWGLAFLIGKRISPDVRDFFEAASPWVLMGLGLAGAIDCDVGEEA